MDLCAVWCVSAVVSPHHVQSRPLSCSTLAVRGPWRRLHPWCWPPPPFPHHRPLFPLLNLLLNLGPLVQVQVQVQPRSGKGRDRQRGSEYYYQGTMVGLVRLWAGQVGVPHVLYLVSCIRRCPTLVSGTLYLVSSTQYLASCTLHTTLLCYWLYGASTLFHLLLLSLSLSRPLSCLVLSTPALDSPPPTYLSSFPSSLLSSSSSPVFLPNLSIRKQRRVLQASLSQAEPSKAFTSSPQAPLPSLSHVEPIPLPRITPSHHISTIS